MRHLSDVTYGQFDEALRSLGFEGRRTPEGFRMYRHKASGTLITVPGGSDDGLMPIRHVDPNVTLLDLRDVIERDRFLALLAGKQAA